MRKLGLLGISLLFGYVVCAAQEQDFSKVEMKVTRVSGNVYMLQGAGGNIGASVGEDGIVIVDDQLMSRGTASIRPQPGLKVLCDTESIELMHGYVGSSRPR